MKMLAASALALALAATSGAASAQSYYDARQGQPYGTYGQPYPDRYGQSSGAVYDYARVIRVDPVIASGCGYDTGYGQDPNCRYRQSTYAGRDDYYDGGYRDPYDDRRYDDRYGYGRDAYDPYRDPYGRDAYGREQRSGMGGNIATVIGGIVGAAIGSQVGGGSARYATAAIGSMVGGMAGRGIYEAGQRDRQPMRTGTVRVCDPVAQGGYGSQRVSDGRVTGYDVTYEYAGREFRTRTDYHPGDRIRVRVDVRPE